MRRPVVILVAAIVLIGALTAGLAWLLNDPKPPAGASRAERLYFAYCVQCHGVAGRGSWRAALFLLRPGDLAARSRTDSDRYLFDIIKYGGAPVGRPGMPSYGFQLSDDDVQALVGYLRQLGRAR